MAKRSVRVPEGHVRDLIAALQAFTDDHDADQADLRRDAGMTATDDPCDCDLCIAARRAITRANAVLPSN